MGRWLPRLQLTPAFVRAIHPAEDELAAELLAAMPPSAVCGAHENGT